MKKITFRKKITFVKKVAKQGQRRIITIPQVMVHFIPDDEVLEISLKRVEKQ